MKRKAETDDQGESPSHAVKKTKAAKAVHWDESDLTIIVAEVRSAAREGDAEGFANSLRKVPTSLTPELLKGRGGKVVRDFFDGMYNNLKYNKYHAEAFQGAYELLSSLESGYVNRILLNIISDKFTKAGEKDDENMEIIRKDAAVIIKKHQVEKREQSAAGRGNI